MLSVTVHKELCSKVGKYIKLVYESTELEGIYYVDVRSNMYKYPSIAKNIIKKDKVEGVEEPFEAVRVDSYFIEACYEIFAGRLDNENIIKVEFTGITKDEFTKIREGI